MSNSETKYRIFFPVKTRSLKDNMLQLLYKFNKGTLLICHVTLVIFIRIW